MSTFVLVHGAWHGGWCWRFVRPLLKGHEVYAPSLTGLGDRAARKLIQKIKTGLGKSKPMFITVQEFSLCTGIPEELIKDFLK